MRIRGLRPLARGPRIRPENFVPGLRDPWQTSGRVRMRGVHLSGDFRGIRAFHGGMGGLGMSHPAGPPDFSPSGGVNPPCGEVLLRKTLGRA